MNYKKQDKPDRSAIDKEPKMKISNLIKKPLNNPIVYSLVMKIIGSGNNKTVFVNEYVRPSKGDKILDFGCGPANILDFMPQDVEYTGVDFNEKYIESARQKYGSRGKFIVADVSEGNENPFAGQFDVVLAHGLIHHLSDTDANLLIRTAYECLNENGRLITLDNVYDKKLNPINKIALKLDRGEYIRTKPNYLSLFSDFSDIQCNIIKAKSRIPYYYIICQVTKR